MLVGIVVEDTVESVDVGRAKIDDSTSSARAAAIGSDVVYESAVIHFDDAASTGLTGASLVEDPAAIAWNDVVVEEAIDHQGVAHIVRHTAAVGNGVDHRTRVVPERAIDDLRLYSRFVHTQAAASKKGCVFDEEAASDHRLTFDQHSSAVILILIRRDVQAVGNAVTDRKPVDDGVGSNVISSGHDVIRFAADVQGELYTVLVPTLEVTAVRKQVTNDLTTQVVLSAAVAASGGRSIDDAAENGLVQLGITVLSKRFISQKTA